VKKPFHVAKKIVPKTFQARKIYTECKTQFVASQLTQASRCGIGTVVSNYHGLSFFPINEYVSAKCSVKTILSEL